MIPSFALVVAVRLLIPGPAAAAAPQTLEQGQTQAGTLLERRRQERLALLAPEGSHEPNEDYLARVKAQASVDVSIPAEGAHEPSEDFLKRLEAQVCVPHVVIEPEGAHEPSEDFLKRLEAQVKVSVTIPPEGSHEPSEDFRKRLWTQVYAPTARIEPEGGHESSEDFLARLRMLVPDIRACAPGTGQGAAWKCEDIDGKSRTCVKIRCASDSCDFSASNICYKS